MAVSPQPQSSPREGGIPFPPPRAIDAARGSPTRCPAPTPPSPSLHSSLHPHPGSAEPDSHRSRGGEPSDGGAAGSGPRPGSGVGLTAAPAGSASASLVSRNRSSEGSARPGTNRHTWHNGDGTAPGCPTAPQPHGHLPHSRALSVTRRSPHRSLLVICPHPGAAPHPHIPAAKAEPYTRWLLSAHRGSGPLPGSETIPTPPPPTLLLNRIHLACTVTLVIRDPSRAGLGLAACHGGILPPPPTQPGPSCFYSFVFLHFSEEQRGARALLCTSGSPRDHDDPESQWVPLRPDSPFPSYQGVPRALSPPPAEPNLGRG